VAEGIRIEKSKARGLWWYSVVVSGVKAGRATNFKRLYGDNDNRFWQFDLGDLKVRCGYMTYLDNPHPFDRHTLYTRRLRKAVHKHLGISGANPSIRELANK
jgi:hypothetical protein